MGYDDPRMCYECGKQAEYIFTYAGGTGACGRHLRRVLKWITIDRGEVTVMATDVWQERFNLAAKKVN